MNPKPQTTNEFAAALRGSLAALKKRRLIFHSEGDLRHELGWELARMGIQNIRAEKPFKDADGKPRRVDLYADGFVAELKYNTTSKFEKSVDEEKFVLAGAPHSRGVHYNFWEDVQRIEHLVKTCALQFGCVVCVANCKQMWDEESQEELRINNPWFSDFWLVDGKTYPKHLKLGTGMSNAKAWVNRKDIRLREEHTLKWEKWHNFRDTKNGLFRYVVVEIRP